MQTRYLLVRRGFETDRVGPGPIGNRPVRNIPNSSPGEILVRCELRVIFSLMDGVRMRGTLELARALIRHLEVEWMRCFTHESDF